MQIIGFHAWRSRRPCSRPPNAHGARHSKLSEWRNRPLLVLSYCRIVITLIGKRSLLGTSNRQQLNSNFEVCLDGFSSNVQELLNNLEFRNQILRLSAPDALGTLIEEFGSLDVNFSSEPVLNADGSVATVRAWTIT